ncbi:MAG: glycosyltransferase [Planctomycetota bacterium]
MKVLLVGTFPPAPGQIAVGQFLQKSCIAMQAAFEELGHSVDTFHYKAVEEQNRRWPVWEYRFQKWCRRWLQHAWLPSALQTLIFRLPGTRRMNALLLDQVTRGAYDLVLLAKTELVDYDNIPKFNRHAVTWYFFTDWIVIARQIQADIFAARSTFANATRSNVVASFNRAGANAIFLTQGADTSLYYPDPSQAREYDVVFVGTLRPNRARYLRHLEQNGIRVATFGKDMQHEHVFGPALADVYRKARIVLNFNTTVNKTGFSLRVFEVMGCGAFMLTEYCKDLETLFQSGRELVWFDSPAECLDLVRRYLADETARETIARAGLARIRAEFTWQHIVGRICAAVEARR